jgi:hypothetical protein
MAEVTWSCSNGEEEADLDDGVAPQVTAAALAAITRW